MSRPSDLIGDFGRAWCIGKGIKPPIGFTEACLSAWLVDRPGAHPFWQRWVVSVVTLSDLPGVEPPVKAYPEAAYELMILALNPEFHSASDPEGQFYFLTPPDLVYQFDGVTDAQAARLTKAVVEKIVVYGHSPDSDFRRWWHDALPKIIEQVREESES